MALARLSLAGSARKAGESLRSRQEAAMVSEPSRGGRKEASSSQRGGLGVRFSNLALMKISMGLAPPAAGRTTGGFFAISVRARSWRVFPVGEFLGIGAAFRREVVDVCLAALAHSASNRRR